MLDFECGGSGEPQGSPAQEYCYRLAMLVYANALTLGARVPDLLTIVATWLSDLVGQPWNARRLLESGRHRFSRGDLQIHTARHENRSLWALELELPDRGVPGRHWQVEVAIRDVEWGGALATVIIRVHDDIYVSSSYPAAAINQPALIRAFLEQGQPDAATPGLATLSLQSEMDARQMAARVIDKARTQTLVLVAQNDAANDLERLQAALAGLAELAILAADAPPLAGRILYAAHAFPASGKAVVVGPAILPTGERLAGRAARQIVGVNTRTVVGGVLKFRSPQILKQHLSIDRLKKFSNEDRQLISTKHSPN